MTPGRVSIIIPARNELFLVETVQDLLQHATGDIEVIAVLDGYWPDPPLPEDERVVQLHKGNAEGMRPAINSAASIATGEYLLKLDAHCSMTQGFDAALKADYHERNWVVVPRRDRLDAETWSLQVTGKIPIDAHYLSYPFEKPGDGKCGLHGTPWDARSRARKDILLDDEMSSQGSCWFMHRDQWMRVGPLNISQYGNFVSEFQEVGNKTWLGGGAVKVNKKVTYLHLHKGPKYGRMYFISRDEMQDGSAFSTWYWMLDKWQERTHDLRWLIEKFSPVPTWPEDLDRAFALGRELLKHGPIRTEHVSSVRLQQPVGAQQVPV